MSARLPVVGSDDGNWGTILNTYLEVSLSSTGTLNSGVVGTTQLANNAVTNAILDSPTQASIALANSSVQSINSILPNSSGALTLTAANVSALSQTTGDARYVLQSSLGAASGVATLGSSSTLTTSQLPSSVTNMVSASVFNVRTYGATGNGTTDDSSAFQAAINAAQTAGGGCVYVPGGTYAVGTSPTITGSYIEVRGDGPDSHIISLASSSANCIMLSSATDISIHGLQIDGNSANQSGAIQYELRMGIFIKESTNIHVFDNVIINTYSAGILASDSSFVIIEGNRIKTTGDNCIFLRPESTGSNTGCTDVTISGNIVSYSNYYGITTLHATKVSITGNVASYCGQSDESQGCGIDCESSIGVAIAGNLCHDNHGGISLRYENEGTPSQRSSDITVTGNTCINNTLSGTDGESSITVNDTDMVTISGNTFSNSTTGVNIGNATQVSVVGNTITGHTNSGVNSYGPTGSTSPSTGSNLLIANNVIMNNSDDGIYVSAPNTLMVGNVLAANTREGIEFISGSSGSVAKNNIIYDNEDNGILVGNSSISNILLEGNSFFNSSGTSPMGRALYEESGGGPTTLVRNRARTLSNQDFYFSNASSIAKDNDFLITLDHNSGTSSITSGSTSVVVSHGLYTNPAVVNIELTSSALSAASYWVDTITSTQFTIHLNVNPGGTVNFAWQARVVA